jgi:hypothetical protein
VFLAVRQWKLARGGAAAPPPSAVHTMQDDPKVLEGEFVVIHQRDPVHH